MKSLITTSTVRTKRRVANTAGLTASKVCPTDAGRKPSEVLTRRAVQHGPHFAPPIAPMTAGERDRGEPSGVSPAGQGLGVNAEQPRDLAGPQHDVVTGLGPTRCSRASVRLLVHSSDGTRPADGLPATRRGG